MTQKLDSSASADRSEWADQPVSSIDRSAEAVLRAAEPSAVTVPSYHSASEWDSATKRTAIVILLIALAIIFWLSRPVLPMLIVGGLISYLLSPIVSLVERLRIPRQITTIVLYVLLLVGVIVLFVYVVPALGRQLASLIFNPDTITRQVSDWIGEVAADFSKPIVIPLLGTEINIDEAARQFQRNIQEFVLEPSLEQVVSYIQQTVSTTTNIVGIATTLSASLVGGIVQLLLTTLFTFFISLYLTMDAPKIRAYVQGLFPQSYQSEIIDLIRHMSHIWQAFFRGQIILAVLIGATTWGALTLVGMPGALVLAIFAGSMEVIPNLGPTLAMIPAVTVALIQGSTDPNLAELGRPGFALVTVGIYFIIQQLENSIIVPRVIGDSVNLHPVVVICGVVVGFSVGGILGAFLAAPIIASLRVLGSYVHAKLLDREPFLAQNAARRRSIFYRRTVHGDTLAKKDVADLKPDPHAEPRNSDESLAESSARLV